MSNTLTSHSADVDLWIDCGEFGASPLRQVTPRMIVLERSFDAPPCDARLIVSIDGLQTVHRVRVVRGISRHRNAARFVRIDENGVAPF